MGMPRTKAIFPIAPPWPVKTGMGGCNEVICRFLKGGTSKHPLGCLDVNVIFDK
jgi:hypothetical protein